MDEKLESPFADVKQGFLLGSDRFLAAMRELFEEDHPAAALPEPLQQRPSLESITAAVVREYDMETGWRGRQRADDSSRAVAACVARKICGYPASQVADALGYRSHSSVAEAIRRYEAGQNHLQPMVRRITKALAIDY